MTLLGKVNSLSLSTGADIHTLGEGDLSYLEMAEKFGADSAFTKPIDTAQFLPEVKQPLAKDSVKKLCGLWRWSPGLAGSTGANRQDAVEVG